MAGDALAVYPLIGMELDEFSVSPFVLGEIKQIIRSIKFKDAKKIADECLNMNNANRQISIWNVKIKYTTSFS